MSNVLEQVAAHAVAKPAAPALRGRGRVLTYADLELEVARVARVLREQRIGVLALAADNSPDWVVVDLAAQKAGVTLVPLPPFFSPDQIRHVLLDSGADAVAVDESATRLMADAHAQPLEPLTVELSAWQLASTRLRSLPAGTSKISYTSGTCGQPKGVCLSQDTMDSVAQSLCVATDAAAIVSHLCLLPLATLLENIAGVYAPLLRGITIALPSLREVGLRDAARLDIRQLIACLALRQPDSIIVLPQMLAALVAAVEGGSNLRASLRFVAVGGALVPRSLLEHAEHIGLPVYEGYGLTECASVVALNTPEARRIGSVGRPLAHVALRIGAGSEIMVRGAGMLGYLGDSATPAAAEIATGDIGHLDQDGYLYITGRRKHVFITSFGRNVQPDWVEAALVATTSIAQAALFGEARPWNVAVIVTAPGADRKSVEDDVDAANRGLPAYAQVHKWIFADEPFTQANGLLTANGRNRRSAIWAHYGARIDACYDESIGSCA